MAAKGSARSAKLSRWSTTIDNLRENLEQFPHISGDLAEMEKMLTQGRELESRLEALRGQSQEMVAELRVLTNQGERMRARLGAHLKAKYGFTSESLVRYGFRPLRINRRRPAVVKPPEEPVEESRKPAAAKA